LKSFDPGKIKTAELISTAAQNKLLELFAIHVNKINDYLYSEYVPDVIKAVLILQRKVSPNLPPEFMFLNLLKGVQAISADNFPLIFNHFFVDALTECASWDIFVQNNVAMVINKHFYVVAFLYIQLSTK
jgi:hypothetical protein